MSIWPEVSAGMMPSQAIGAGMHSTCISLQSALAMSISKPSHSPDALASVKGG